MSNIQSRRLAFIGGGNMGAAIIAGLLAQGSTSAQNIIVSEPSDVNRDKLASKYSVRTTSSNAEAASGSDIVVLAVKPQVCKEVCQELASSWDTTKNLPMVVSIVAGVTMTSLAAWLSGGGKAKAPKLVRVMPNTPALVGEGASGAYAGEGVSGQDRETVTALLGSFGKVTEWVEKEELIDVVTGLSGSGPAYFFSLVEHMVSSAVAQGMDRDQAERLAKQTCFGAGKMLVSQSESPAQLRVNVTSPKGTTEAALKSFSASGFEGIVDKAVRAAVDRAEELGKVLGE